MTKPTSKADIRTTFRKQLEKLAKDAEAAHKAYKLEGQRKWYHPELEGWSGDLFDLEGIAQAYDRQENHEDFLNALQDAQSPGAIGDLAASQFQGDWLAALERAFRRRHASVVRSRLHAAGRLFGHGHEKGPLKQGVMKWLEGLVQNAKGGGG